MLSVDEAVAALVDAGRRRASTRVPVSIPVSDALGQVLAREVMSEVDVPPGDNSAMDGYAFAFEDARALDFKLPITRRLPAGTAPRPHRAGTAARIFTGAELPPGADTVAMQEVCSLDGDCVRIDPHQVVRGDNVRPRGQDVKKGEIVLGRGVSLRPQEMGLLASVGRAHVEVFPPLKVALFSTGDELVEPGQALLPGQIFNSNRATLAGLLTAWHVDMVDLGIVADKPEQVVARLAEAADCADVVISSGGVSVGEEDHVKKAVEEAGELALWKIAIKPGKPLAFGDVGGKPFFGLPGNPASVFVTGLLLLRPFLRAMAGCTELTPQPQSLPARFCRKPVTRQEYLRARRTASGIEIHGNQSSGMLSSACWGDGLAIHYPGTEIREGDPVDFIAYSDLL